MNKQELVKYVAETAGLTRDKAADAVNSVLNAIEDELMHGGEVSLQNWGKFFVRPAAQRVGRNPSTGESVVIPACNKVVFQAGVGLKRTVNL